MNHVGFAPAGANNVVRLSITALIAAAVLAVALLSGPATASADSNVNNCTSGLVNVVCIGQINTTPVTVNIGDVNAFSGNDLNTLTNNLNEAFLSVVNVSDINILSADLTAIVQTTVNTVVTNTVNTTTKACTALVTPPAVSTQTSAITITCS